jgi:hypothetical protein
MLDHHVAASATIAKPVPASPDTKAALKYLEASGANAISITSGTGGVVLGVCYRADAVRIYWLPAASARAVSARARKIAGDAVDVATVIAALKEAATQCRVTLTEHDIAIARADAMAQRLDACLAQWRQAGALKEFLKAYRSRRLAAKARGEGFMSFPVAELRLRRAMISVLQNGGTPKVGTSLFAEVFDT